MESWHNAYLHEIDQARLARQSGNEGRARVCSRRAASILIAEYLHRQGLSINTSSTHERLRLLSTFPGLTYNTYEIISHLLMRVDESFSLPESIDLISDAQRLAHELSLDEN
jgi:hypothetical protein